MNENKLRSKEKWEANNDEACIRVVETNYSVNNDITKISEYSAAPNPKKVIPQLYPVEYVLNPFDKTIFEDANGKPLTVDRMLATKPLRHELLTRPGPGGRKLTYMAGESVTRSLNEIFGFDGWHLQIIKTERTVCEQEPDKKNGSTRWNVAYMAHVRITHARSGTYKEDLGAGDAIDKHLPTAIQHAMKASITDALKRAARHFGDKLGNILYQGNFSVNSAPRTLQDALEQYDKGRILTKGSQSSSNASASIMKTENQQHLQEVNKENRESVVNTVPSRSILPIQSNAGQPTSNMPNVHNTFNKNYDSNISSSSIKTQNNNTIEQRMNSDFNPISHQSKSTDTSSVPENSRKPENNNHRCNVSKDFTLPLQNIQGSHNNQYNIMKPPQFDSTCTMMKPPSHNASALQQQKGRCAVILDTPCNSIIHPPRTSAEGLRTTSMFGSDSNQMDSFIDTPIPFVDTSWLSELNRPVTSTGRASTSGVSPPSMLMSTPIAAGNDQSSNKRPVPVTVPHGGATKKMNISNPYNIQ